MLRTATQECVVAVVCSQSRALEIRTTDVMKWVVCGSHTRVV